MYRESGPRYSEQHQPALAPSELPATLVELTLPVAFVVAVHVEVPIIGLAVGLALVAVLPTAEKAI